VDVEVGPELSAQETVTANDDLHFPAEMGACAFAKLAQRLFVIQMMLVVIMIDRDHLNALRRNKLSDLIQKDRPPDLWIV
jgi:hypothetical protein